MTSVWPNCSHTFLLKYSVALWEGTLNHQFINVWGKEICAITFVRSLRIFCELRHHFSKSGLNGLYRLQCWELRQHGRPRGYSTRSRGMVSMSLESESEVLILISDWKLGYGHTHTHTHEHCMYIYIYTHTHAKTYLYVCAHFDYKGFIKHLKKTVCWLLSSLGRSTVRTVRAREVLVHWLQGWVLPSCCGFHHLPPMWIRQPQRFKLCFNILHWSSVEAIGQVGRNGHMASSRKNQCQ